MKTFILAIVALSAGYAAASTPAQSAACGAVAELAVSVTKTARNGMPWSRVEEIQRNGSKDTGPNLLEASIAINREAYYSWSSFDDGTVRQLAYMKCMSDLPAALLADHRAQK